MASCKRKPSKIFYVACASFPKSKMDWAPWLLTTPLGHHAKNCLLLFFTKNLSETLFSNYVVDDLQTFEVGGILQFLVVCLGWRVMGTYVPAYIGSHGVGFGCVSRPKNTTWPVRYSQCICGLSFSHIIHQNSFISFPTWSCAAKQPNWSTWL